MTAQQPTASRLVNAYVTAVAVCGAGVLLRSAFEAAWTPETGPWLATGILAIAAGSFRLTFASVEANIAIDDAIMIAMAMLFGRGPATLAIAVGAIMLSWRRGHPWQKVAFNATSLA